MYKAEAGGSPRAQDQPCLHREFQATQGQSEICLIWLMAGSSTADERGNSARSVHEEKVTQYTEGTFTFGIWNILVWMVEETNSTRIDLTSNQQLASLHRVQPQAAHMCGNGNG